MAVEFEWQNDQGHQRFIAAHAPALARLALLLTGSREDAEDVVQDAAIAVAPRWPELREEAALARLRERHGADPVDPAEGGGLGGSETAAL